MPRVRIKLALTARATLADAWVRPTDGGKRVTRRLCAGRGCLRRRDLAWCVRYGLRERSDRQLRQLGLESRLPMAVNGWGPARNAARRRPYRIWATRCGATPGGCGAVGSMPARGP